MCMPHAGHNVLNSLTHGAHRYGRYYSSWIWFHLRKCLTPTIANQIYYNVGNMVYALLGFCTLFFILLVGFIFLALWPVTRQAILVIVAWGIGLVRGMTEFKWLHLSDTLTIAPSTSGYNHWNQIASYIQVSLEKPKSVLQEPPLVCQPICLSP